MKLPSTIIFRWETDKKQAFSNIAVSKGLTPSQFLRQLLNAYLVKKYQGTVK